MKWIALVAALAACGKHDRPIDKEAARALFDEITIDAPPGISDLTIDDRGVLWAVAERDRKVLEIALGSGSATVTSHDLTGIPAGIDTEALAWLGDGSFAIGVEGSALPLAGIVYAKLSGNSVVAGETQRFDAAQLGVAPTINHGIEAVCGKAGQLLAAEEIAGVDPDGTRWASLVRIEGDKVTRAKLHLTTKTGKISALHCTFDADGTAHGVAVERHYSVSRVLSFDAARGANDIVPKLEHDLAPVVGSLNIEGIAKLPDGRLVLVNDNQNATVSGSTKLLVFHR
ncbi:MAG: hypothetical protein HOV81_39100 [Kofleriaceae bacterium]|nr:hypothetical protein [Kofleriaceae bacterium]